ncbi:MAG: mandelate racemase/muconate lactonizing enzyme family protein [Ignavibacteriales bacterium]
MADRIAEITTTIVEVPLKKQWKISLYAASVRRHAVVRIRTASGLEGFGEASPSPAFMGESADTVKTVVDRHLAPAVIGADPMRIADVHKRMEQSIYGMEAAKSAVDMAVYDLAGKAAGVGVCELLGGPVRERVALSWVVGIQGDEAAVDEAVAFADRGFGVIKVKVGIEPERDVRIVREIWRAVEGKARIRLDANQGYDVTTAIQTMRSIEEFCPVECLEQPVRRWNLAGLAEIRKSIRTPVMVDEAVFGIHDALQVAATRAADIINIKIGKVGGIYPAMKVASIAESAGMKCAVGSNLELGIGSAAALHFAASARPVEIAGDLLIGPFLHERDIADPSLTHLVDGGEATVPSGTGLGVETHS